MLRLRRVSQNYRELFVARYGRLLAWALQLAQGDRSLAEDLLHDLYVLFTIHEPEIDLLQNVDGYFYTCLRNLYLSQIRRTTRSRFQQLSIIEYESAKTGLRAIDPRTQIEVQDDLRRICQYACARKDTSRAGSVLILRFFHGYYPSEIVQVLRSSRRAVDDRLLTARVEARSYLDDPRSLSFIGSDNPLPEIFPASFARKGADLLGELRQMIFASRQGECISPERLQNFYRAPSKREGASALECAELAHLVSCVRCLDEVNRMLKLPPLSQRYLTGNAGRDPGGRGGDDGSATGGGPSPSRSKSGRAREQIESGQLNDWDNDAREAFEHKPQELCVAVNGYLLGSQKVGLEQNELTLSLSAEERPSFIEVFSEQGIRLSLLSIGDPPPGGAGEQHLQVKLSDARELGLTLHFTSPFFTLNVSYSDPALRNADAIEPEGATEGSLVVPPKGLPSRPAKFALRRRRLSAFIQSLRARLFTSRLWVTPVTVTALFAAILVASLLLYLRAPAPVVTAADLLRRATDAEELAAVQPETVLHRTISIEEKNARGELIARHKVEIWHSAERGITARRLYDERGQLVAGDWRRADGVQTLYHHGAKPQLQLAPEKRDAIGSMVTFDNAWQLSLSAKEFNLLIVNASNAQVEERPNAYVISADVSPPSGGDRAASSVVEKAAITLNRTDLRAIEQRLIVRQGYETREFKFTETAFEQKRSSSVAPTLFDPEPELLSSTELETRNAKPEIELALDTRYPTPSVATAALEVDVIDLLNRAGAFTGEQIDVSRTADGRLQVNGLVETDTRKAELLAALTSVRNNPAVRINIETVAEAQAREARKQVGGSQTPGTVTVDQFTATENPVFNELRKRFSESEARAFADRVVRRSIQARDHATALRKLSERFSASDLTSLSAADRTRWLNLLRGHAAQFLAANESLQRELQTVFADTGGGGGSRTLDSDREIQAAIRELYGLAVACDEDLRASFALFTNAGPSAEVKTAKFWRALNTASALARSVQMAR